MPVYVAGEHLFAGAALAEHQDGRAHRRHPAGKFIDALHRGCLADDGVPIAFAMELALQPLILLEQAAQLHQAIDLAMNIFQDNRLRQKILGAVAQRLDGIVHMRVRGDEQDKCFRADLQEPLQHVDPIDSWEIDVAQGNVEAMFARQFQSLFAAAANDHREAFLLQIFAEAISDERFIVDDENRSGIGLSGHRNAPSGFDRSPRMASRERKRPELATARLE
jgi:hypothetical protein